MRKRLGKNDIIFLMIILIMGIGFCIIFYTINSKKGREVIITVDGNEFGRYPLGVDTLISITDENGKEMNVLEISDGYADMVKADCPDGLCVSQKKISKDKETIVCLPNRIVVTVSSADSSSDVDAVAK